MGFEYRNDLAKNFEFKMDEILTKKGLYVINLSYENLLKDAKIRNKLRYLYSIPEVIYIRFQPDRLIFNKTMNKFMIIDYKVCNTPIYSKNRIKFLIEKSGDRSLSHKNVGAIEYTAIKHYKELAEKLKLNIALVIYSTFSKRKILAENINNIDIKYHDSVVLGMNNASGTPYANINLDELKSMPEFFREEFGINISQKNEKEIIEYMENQTRIKDKQDRRI